MSRVRYLKTKYDAGTVYGAECDVCGTVCYVWGKREAKQLGKQHEREHRRSGR
jgi:hypothetical protein